MSDPSSTAPTGIPDPNNPGYDTAGYPIARTGAATARVGGVADPGLSLTTSPTGGQVTGAAPAASTAGNPLAPFGETFTPPTGNAPLPPLPTYPAFAAPSAADALSDPGYQFVRDQGEGALQNWAAAKGTLNDSETADALINYGQQAASTQYGNVYNRDAQTYNTNAATQFQPQLMQWGAQIGQNNLQYSNQWNQFLQDYNQYLNRFNTTFGVATAA